MAADIRIEERGDRSWLVGLPFEGLTSAAEVHQYALKIADRLKLAATETQRLALDILSTVQDRGADGITSTLMITNMAIAILEHADGMSLYATMSSTPEERVRFEAAQRELQYQEIRAEISDRFKAAFRNDGAAQVQKLLLRELDTGTMNLIAELIERDLQNKLSDLGMQGQFDRFNASANHREIFGDEARHAVTNRPLPRRPMYPEEALQFIRELARRWFQYRAR